MAWLISVLIVLASSFATAAVPSADQLKQIKLPPGFKITVFAEADNARQMALSPAGTLFIGSRHAGNVYVIPNALNLLKTENAKPVKAQVIASRLTQPSGVIFHSGNLYVAAVSEIVVFPEIEKHLGGKPVPKVLETKFPTEVHHGWKHIEIGPDGLLYVPIGAPCNICLSNDKIYASIARMTLDGKNLEVIAHGVRNTLGLDWHPRTKELWFSDNGRDLWGDDRPGDELNRVAKVGTHFGYPFCHDMGLNDPEFGKDKNCTAKGPYQFPALRLGPHVAALGLKFYRGSQFPLAYKGKLFIAEHGSWNRSNKIGYRVMNVDVSADGRKASNYKVFAEGWRQGESAWGRPVYLLELPDGSFLLSDDAAGVIYRISYEGKTSQKK